MHYTLYDLALRLEKPGRLLPWLGPALRGSVALFFKRRVCQHSHAEQDSRWRYCTGCPHLSQCSYGQLFEPEPQTEHTRLTSGDNALRPLVLAPYFPLPSESRDGFLVPLRVLGLGSAVQHLPVFLQSLGEAGKRRGLGNDHISFTLDERQEHTAGELLPEDLPRTPDALPGKLPRVGIGLTSPLFLNRPRENGKGKLAISCPTFSDLFRAALRSVGELFRLYDAPLPADFAALKAAAQSIRMIDHCFEPYRQDRHSSRNPRDYRMEGVIGGGIYADVPMSLLPWLLWAGRFHVGTCRIQGAGGWRILLD